MSDIASIIGLTFVSATCEKYNGDDSLVFVTDTGRTFKQYHDQDCCESVYIEDICGDLKDLVGSPIVRAEERFENVPEPADEEWYGDSATYTFYELATNKGSVTIRWYGTSNGYYSETASFEEV